MFFASNKKNARDTQAYLDNLQQSQLHLNLNGVHLIYGDNCRWTVESSDLDTAAKEIDLIIEERDELVCSLKEANTHIEELNAEVMETNDVKNISMTMLMEERQKNIQLQKDLAAYQEELRESYRIILELKNYIGSLTVTPPPPVLMDNK